MNQRKVRQSRDQPEVLTIAVKFLIGTVVNLYGAKSLCFFGAAHKLPQVDHRHRVDEWAVKERGQVIAEFN
jgi:hypothetical protein